MAPQARMIEFEFEIGQEVYNNLIGKNGRIELRKYQEEKGGQFEMYYFVAPIENGFIADWYDRAWLEHGHKDIID